uniref:Uncharacterized protein n=1 Tax=Lactuca sativa TaxID=4236 RepID=A0A9R1V0I4_LACSA|nr:hypothetical protein LSAT_V11C700355980 [Lactuca sativa]
MFMLHVLKLAFMLDPDLAPIPANLIPKEGKTVDPSVISELEKQRTLRRESEELCVGHIKNSLSDRLYDFYALVKDPRELWNALELKYKAHEEGINKYLESKYLEFQMANDKSIMEKMHELQVMVGAIIAKLPPPWKYFSKRMMEKFEDYSLDDLMKHRCIEEEARIRDKHGKVGSSVHHVSVGVLVIKASLGDRTRRAWDPRNKASRNQVIRILNQSQRGSYLATSAERLGTI